MIKPGESESESVSPATAYAIPSTRDQAGSLAGRELNGRFALLAKVASGRRGDVYRAHDRLGFDGDLPGRRLAIKLLHATLAAQPGGLYRFQRSFHVAQALSHPNVLSVFDVDCDTGIGQHYMTMELLNGSSLRSILEQLGSQPVPRGEALRMIRGICAALIHMHSKGYIHCDVRPASIFVNRRLETVLTSFEHAVHRTCGSAGPSNTDAQLDARAAYLSPQLRSGEPPRNSDDVFSLACVAYELFTGRPPSVPPAPIAGLSRRHWNAIKKALEPERRKRTQGITAFARQMAVLESRNAQHRPMAWALAAATAVVLTAIAIIGMQSRAPESKRAVAATTSGVAHDATFSLESVHYKVSEQTTAVRLKVIRSGNLDRPSSLAWWTEGNTAMAGADYVDLGRSTLQFEEGQAEHWIYVPIVVDSQREGSESFHVYIGDADTDTGLGAIRRATVTIEPDA